MELAVNQYQSAEISAGETVAILQSILEYSSDGIFIVEPILPENSCHPRQESRENYPFSALSSLSSLSSFSNTQRFNLDFRLVLANPAYQRMLPLTTPEGIGKRLQDCLPPTITQTTLLHLNTCFKSRHPMCYEQLSETETGSYALLITLLPIFAREGQLIKIVGICHDLTERRSVQAAAQLLQSITLAIADTQDFDSALGVALHKICEATGWNYGEAWVVSLDNTEIELSPAWHGDHTTLEAFYQSRQDLTFPMGSSFIGKVWSLSPLMSAGEIWSEPDDLMLRVDMAIAAGFQAGISIPILANGEILALLVFFMFEDSLQDQRLISLVSAISVQLGVVIHHKKYRNIFENAVAGIYQTTIEGRYQAANPMLAYIYGYDSPQELMLTITNIAEQIYVNSQRRYEFNEILQQQGVVWGFESQVYRKDGSTIWISESGRAIRNAAGELIGYEGTVEDISRRKQAEMELKKRDSLLQGAAKAMHHLLTDSDHETAIIKALATLGEATDVERVYIYESHTHPTTHEPALSLRFEWLRQNSSSINRPDRQNLTPQSFGLTQWPRILEVAHSITDFSQSLPLEERELLEEEGMLSRLIVPIRVNNALWGYLGFDDDTTGQFDLGLVQKPKTKSHKLKIKSQYPFTSVTPPISFPSKEEAGMSCGTHDPLKFKRRWSDGEVSILMVIAESIGGALQRQQSEEVIRHQALHDRLTGLPNRILLHQRLSLALENAYQSNHLCAVMFLDLDHFKTINDTLGHAVGDLLLQSVVERLKRCLREGDTVARWGGDEFVLILPYICRAKDAATVARRILELLQSNFTLEGHKLSITSSIGIALYPRDGKDAEQLIKNADVALYHAKEGGRNNYQLYNPEDC